MKLLNKRVLSSRVWCVTALALSGMSAGFPAGAQEDEDIATWSNPGNAPFQGTREQAGRLMVALGELTPEGWSTAMEVFDTGDCGRYFMQDGDIVVTTHTDSNGGHQAVRRVVDFGDDVPANDIMRLTVSCRLNDGTDRAIAMPFVCGNWTVQYRDPEPVPQSQSATIVRKRIPIGQVVGSEMSLNLNSTVIGGYGVFYTPNLNIRFENTLQSSGYTEVYKVK